MSGEKQNAVIELPPPSEKDARPIVREANGIVEVLDDHYYQANFGISLAEAQQTVRYADKEAPLGEVLEHKTCPLGSWVKEAYQEGGREAVVEKFSLFGQLATEFQVILEPIPNNEKKNLIPSRTN